ncbi:MAG: ATP-binding protein [Ruminococcus sp.]|nr:ATP-binding protein [Ruminococcus sp.]
MNPEIFDKAQIILQNRRHNAVIENDRRIEEINRKLPQIREINNKIANAGKDLVKICMSGCNAVQKQQMIEKLKCDNLDAQAASRWHLVNNGYPADYLEIHYNCPKCHDTGYDDNAVMCECFNQLCGKLEADEMNKHSQLKLSSFDTFSLSYYKDENYFTMKRIFDYLKNYAVNFNLHSESILIFGNTGLGKTHLSLAVANKVLEKGYSVIYDSAINILHEIEKEHFSREHNSEITDLVMQTDLLILDDLGTEHTTPFYTSTIYNIINTRLNRDIPTIISTNLSYENIQQRYDERVVSRITTQYKSIRFCGTDIRWQKKNKQKNGV